MPLSKSHYVRGRQCLKSLWLYNHRRELLDDADDAQKEARFAVGDEVGELAQQCFPGGVEVEFDAGDYPGMVAQTAALLEAGRRTIYEATFKEKGVFVRADVLHKPPGADRWDVIEVKSSTGVKDYHLQDAAVQWFVIGDVLPLGKAFIMHINGDYVRGGALNLRALFTLNDVTAQVVAAQASVANDVEMMETMLAGNEPEIDIGEHCDDPFACDFKPYCWRHVPRRSVFNLYRLAAKKKFALYRSGLVRLQDAQEHAGKNVVRRLQMQTLDGKPAIDKSVLREFIASVAYPIAYLDFETFQNAVPRFAGEKPYTPLPFQYSLHVEREDDSLAHRGFLGDEFGDPRRALAERLLSDLPQSGSVLAFNAAFERRCVRHLAQRFPDLRKPLETLDERFIDLIKPFRQGGYYHADFNGGFSLKSVLPALFPGDDELDYQALAIGDGGAAMDAFSRLRLIESEEERRAVRRDLLDYCRLDTLAMVRIFGFLRKAADLGD